MRPLLLAAMLSLTACGHTLTVMGEDGTQGVGTASRGIGAGTAKLAMGGETYAGQWTAVTAGANSVGTLLMVSEKGSRLRCAFEYGGWTDAGFGTCQDPAGRKFDMQIK